jgi:hypothetical protein
LGWIPWPLGGGPTPTAPSPGDEASLLIPFIISLLT